MMIEALISNNAAYEKRQRRDQENNNFKQKRQIKKDDNALDNGQPQCAERATTLMKQQ